ncbi:hypothetical protein EDD21DRAFT_368117 [Dissophora ornata]|nr:hypothetical protein BGZ58_001094 [Dissophora ornata]KAI8603770.1 hypothetical protein EDD21DRAFT_368117 [Dissophora ornata]
MSWVKAYAFLRPVRVSYAFFAFVNVMIIVISEHFTNSTDDTNNVQFSDFQQIIINGGLFFVCVYGHYFNTTWALSPIYRTLMVVIVCGLSILYAIALVGNIQEHGGCSSLYFARVATRCTIQYAISAIELLWSVLLIADVVITIHQLKDVDWQNKVRVEEEERAQEGAIRYQPDLSLYETGNRNGVDDDAHAVSTEVEMEPLPAYMPKADADQPRIMDMTNRALRQENPSADPVHGSGSTSSSAGSSSRVTESETALAPAPADPSLPSYTP